tara:strand:+ start:195 stop:407 length:213 start_codon:yes stop_codon:yes gene_type:complete
MDNNINMNMKLIKQVTKTKIRIKDGDNVSTWNGYDIGSLPPTFGFFYNKETEKKGIGEWFNYKGLTYIQK